MRSTWISFAFGLVLVPGLALADPQFSAQDIIDHFSKNEPESGGKGKERGVFIGATGFGNEATATSAAAASNQAAAAATGDAPLVIPQTGTTRPKTSPDTSGVAVASTGNAAAAAPVASSAYDLLVTFRLGSDQLTRQARQNLDEFANALLSPELGAYKFAVDGHTDATGTENFNLGLSRRRAASVVQYLRDRGVAPDRLIPTGYGESRPLRSDPYDPVNRRVETRRLQ